MTSFKIFYWQTGKFRSISQHFKETFFFEFFLKSKILKCREREKWEKRHSFSKIYLGFSSRTPFYFCALSKNLHKFLEMKLFP